MKNKTVIVTGAASGLGFAIAKKFSENGLNVVLADLNIEHGENAVEELKKSGGSVLFVKTDVSNPGDCQKLAEKTVEHFGSLNFAVNNAGISSHNKKAGEYPIDGWNHIINVNLNGVFYGMRYQIPEILKSGGGAIVNISSVLGLVGTTGGTVAYTAAKHGVIGLTRTAALDYAQEGLRINAVCPGYLNTPLLNKYNQKEKDEIAAIHPMNRLGEPAEVANLVYWLCSEEAGFVTGAAYAADGGYTAW